MRPSWVEVDLEAVRQNVRAIAKLVAPAKLCAVVKADGYGHGDVPVAEAAVEAGAFWLAVALVEEGVRLREAGVEAPILLLSEPPLSDAREIVHWNLTPTVYRPDFVEALGAAGAGRVQVKVDTGMHRVGVAPSDLPALVETCRSAGIIVEAIWTHFAVSEEVGGFTTAQIATFNKVIDGLDVPMIHLANTAGGILYPEARCDMVRAGIGIYGIHPGPATRSEVTLKPAMRIVSRVGYVQRLPAGDRPSYGRRRALNQDSNVVTVPIGYADGLPRGLSDQGEVLIGGRRHPLAGTVTMDQIIVDLGDMAAQVGDEVILIGRQGDEETTADEWAGLLGTIAYEVVLSDRSSAAEEILVTLTSIPGIEVGHWTDLENRTGCTVVVLPEPNITAVEVRGGAPGTRETDLLAVGMRVEQAQAILLTGGSAFGLAAADGVVRELLADGRGHPTPAGPVPIVPGAVVFDLPLTGGGRRPGPEEGAAAYRAASAGPVEMGLVGAGTGTSCAKWRGFEFLVKSGIGSAVVDTPDGHKVAALVVLNPVGDVFTLEGDSLTGGSPVPPAPGFPPQAGSTMTNTTLVVVVTTAAMSRAELTRLAVRSHDALGVCLRPAHTRFDGDVVFVSAVGMSRGDVDLAAEGAFAATGRAIEASLEASL